MKKFLFSLCFAFITFCAFSTGHVVNTFIINNATCGGANGNIRATVSGGVGPFTYSWNTAPVQNNDTAFAVLAGTYTVTVTDQNDMSTSTGIITVTNSPGPTSVVVIPSNASCGGSTGSLTIGAVTGGTAGYTYSVNGGPYTTTTNYSGLAAGNYTVVVKDANGCTFTTTTSVGNNSGPTSVIVNGQNFVCEGTMANFVVGPVTGGTAPYTYTWIGPNGFTSTIPNPIINAWMGASGTYTLTVTDANGCNTNALWTLMVNPLPIISFSPQCVSCFGMCNGAISTFINQQAVT